MFELHPKLSEDSSLVGHLAGCQLRLSHDSRYPWLILIPECNGIRETHQLPQPLRQDTFDASCALAELMQQALGADKMNVAALGNLVPQLHLHHIARFEGDDAWPGPVWGALPAQPYGNTALQAALDEWRQRLAALPGFTAAGT